MSESNALASFRDLNLADPILSALETIGYETPSPIQLQAIPPLLEGRDVLGHAPTGTGKTAAFALPLLSRLDVAQPHVQVLALTPTRELALQVSEAFQSYAEQIPGFHVLPIYGGQDYGPQLKRLRRGAHVVVGTPGRIMDHLRRGSLKLNQLHTVVIDEADEMLRMGFVEEVEWILEQTPEARQVALFSATMPKEVRSIANRHLKEPAEVSIKAKTATAETIRQRYWSVSGVHKLDALTRLLEVEPIDGVLVFVRTRSATTELAARLEARGYAAGALNGDMQQNQREKTVERLKKGTLDVLVATDVAARGLDVDRVSHVVNYDIPYDTESYIHRIGRTGRAGRQGEAILFVAPRERRMLGAIERATRQKIEQLTLPSTETVNNHRLAQFKQRISDTLAAGELGFMQGLIEQYQQEHNVPLPDIAAALAKLAIGDAPFLLEEKESRKKKRPQPHEDQAEVAPEVPKRKNRKRERAAGPKIEFETYRVEVGREHGVEAGNIVGAIANEAGLDIEHIGKLRIEEDHSTVELPPGMPRDVYRDLRKVWVNGRRLQISRLTPRKPTGKKTKDQAGKGKSRKRRKDNASR